MLLGAYGREAARRVAAGVAALAPTGVELEVIDRQELVLALEPHSRSTTVAQGSSYLCVLDGDITAAPWHDAEHRAGQPCSAHDVLAAWRHLGPELVAGMRGSFVLVLWESARRSGLIVRDPTGLRGLVRAQTQGALVFASEAKELLAALPQAPAPDPVALAFWLSDDNCWADRTFFEGVAPLRPGRLLELRNGEAIERTWWKLRYVAPQAVTLEEAGRQVSDAITHSIVVRARRGENVGVLLSGGIDSASVAALAGVAPQLGHGLAAYSAVFPHQPRTDERQRISEVARTLAIPSLQMSVHGGSPAAGAMRFIARWGLPPPSVNCFFWPLLLERVRDDGVRLLLGGEGGDELFALSPPLLADHVRSGRPLAALGLARRVPGGDRQSTATLTRFLVNEAATATLPASWLRRLRRPSRAWTPQPPWLAPQLAKLHRAAQNPLAWREVDGPRWWAHSAHTLTTGREVMGISDGIRRLYEGGGLRVHHPLLDPDVVEVVLRLPPELAFDARFDRALLRAAVSERIPESIRTSVVKSDFSPVLVAGITDSDLRLARELLLAPGAHIRELIDTRANVEHLIDGASDRHRDAPGRWAIDVWRLLCARMLAAGTRGSGPALSPPRPHAGH